MKPQTGHNLEERLASLFIFAFYLLAISLPLSEAIKQISMGLIMVVGIYLFLTKRIGIKDKTYENSLYPYALHSLWRG